MWIFFEDSFVSVVADPSHPGRVLVRSNHPDHITNFLPGAEVWVMTGGQRGEMGNPDDYLYRACVSKEGLKAVLTERIDELAFGTFRERIADPVYYDACNRARYELYALDRTIPPKYRPGTLEEP